MTLEEVAKVARPVDRRFSKAWIDTPKGRFRVSRAVALGANYSSAETPVSVGNYCITYDPLDTRDPKRGTPYWYNLEPLAAQAVLYHLFNTSEGNAG